MNCCIVAHTPLGFLSMFVCHQLHLQLTATLFLSSGSVSGTSCPYIHLLEIVQFLMGPFLEYRNSFCLSLSHIVGRSILGMKWPPDEGETMPNPGPTPQVYTSFHHQGHYVLFSLFCLIKFKCFAYISTVFPGLNFFIFYF